MDKITTEKRSWNMSRIGSKNTKPEITVRKKLFSLGFRFRLHNKKLPGNPDVVLKKFNTVIFVHGCFWHQHRNCIEASKPKTNSKFWSVKLKKNTERDNKNIQKLKKLGWNVLVIWECETEKGDILNSKIHDLLNLKQ